MDKKKMQLGMNPGTASHRLVKDILWDYICKSGHNKCFQCGGEMGRENFSIEHKVPWLDSENPVDLFFDLNNISFSHHSCNLRAARRPNKLNLTDEEKRARDAERKREVWNALSKEEQQELRRKKYLRHGC